MTVKRYSAHTNIDDFKADWHEKKDGPMVRYEDYAALLKDRDALASENSTIKTMNDCLAEELRGYESDGAFDGPDMHKLWHSHAGALPATDAAIAKIKADGIENFGDELLSDLRGDCWDEHDIKYIEMQLNCHLGELRKESGK